MDIVETPVIEQTPKQAPKELLAARVPGYKKPKTGKLDEQSEPTGKKVESLRYTSAILARRLAEEIRITLDSPLPKKERVRLVRELTWSYGVLLDKAAGGSDSGMVQIKFPAEVLAALKVGIALQVAPKPIEPPQVIVESTS